MIQETKQIIDITVSFDEDHESTRMNYEDYQSRLEQLQNKKRKTKDNKQEIEDIKSQMDAIENNNSVCLYIDVKANVKMPCGHYEEFYSGVGGCWYNFYEGMEDFKRNYSDYINDDIENIKEQIKQKLPNQVLDFNIIYKENE